jgi:hypothetical protein
MPREMKNSASNPGKSSFVSEFVTETPHENRDERKTALPLWKE